MRASLDWQLEHRALVCPVTKKPLSRQGDSLRSEARTYPIAGGVPLLLEDHQWAQNYLSTSPELQFEERPVGKISAWIQNDRKSKKSIEAMHNALDVPEESLCISIGGGPTRHHPDLVNVNIGPLKNVDIVADAHLLPYSDNCVDAVFSDAVFEHLQHPTVAAAEMFRVMKPGAKAFVCTPFLQAYHGFPHHYQNFTVTGHRFLFERAGFEVIESGVSVGPIYTMTNLLATFCSNLLPWPFGKIGSMTFTAARAVISPLDYILASHKNAHVLASTTYLVARKP